MAASMQNVQFREEDIDNDVLIEGVEKRPAVYDKKLKEYSDINLKIKMWEEISKVIFSNIWGNLSQQEKTEAGKLIQKRWKNLRACFSRELRDQKSTKSGQAAKKRRKYKYFDQLLFLVPSMDTRETSGNAEDIDCEDSRDADEATPQRSEYSRKKKTNTISYEERLLDILNKKRIDDNKFIEALKNNKSSCDDDDKEKHFALSLVPLLKAVPEENKLEVQIKILQIFQDLQKQNSHNTQRTHSPMYSPSHIGCSPQNFRIKPNYNVTLPPSSSQNQRHITTNTQPNSSPSLICIPPTSPQHLQIKPKYSASLPPPPPSPQNQLYLATYTQSNSSPPDQNPMHYEDSSASSSIQSYISQFAADSNDGSEVYDICQEYNITTENH